MYDIAAPAIMLGTRIVYHHELTGFSCPPILRAFPRLTPEEIFALVPGDILYIDYGNLRRGRHRVYGWVKGTVTEARYVHAQRWKVGYVARRHKGYFHVELDGFCANLSRPDEEKLQSLIEQYPQYLHV